MIALQSNTRSLSKKIATELDKELLPIGLGVADLNIISINYPPELQKMAEKMAAQSFVTDVNKYASISLADSFGKDGGANPAGTAAQFGMGMQMAQQMAAGFAQQGQSNNKQAQDGDRFCPKCRKMVSSKFCPDCGTQTV